MTCQMTTDSMSEAGALDWLGFPCRFSRPTCSAAVPKGTPAAPLGAWMSPKGDATTTEASEAWLWTDAERLHLRVRCHTAAMDRVRELAARQVPYPRDAWGDDAIEVQIDVGRTQSRYCHFILPPNGIPVTLAGFNNRQEQGWHPAFDFRVSLEPGAWVVEAAFPFAILGSPPAAGAVWGFNLIRTNPSEPGQYVQWAPTLGDALRPELFGEIRFGGSLSDRAVEIAAFASHAARRKAYFLASINGLTPADALRALGMPDWRTWGEHLAQRAAPLPIRWEGILPGPEGIPASDRALVMDLAATLADKIAGWSADPPAPAAFAAEAFENLGDAYLLTGDRRYVEAFERGIAIHGRVVRQILAGLTDPHARHHTSNPYHDAQITRAEMLAYTYLVMRQAGLSADTHATMMWTILRGGRFAAFNISTAYNYGNHQVYESAGLATVAALFPEFLESDEWARTASRAIRLHLEREVYPDGAYRERCGYHQVAVTFTMQAIATIRANGLEVRFPELASPEMTSTLEHMHHWVLLLTAPDGIFPAFGDTGSYMQLCFLRRGAIVFGRTDLAWPLRQLAPAMVPAGIEPREPEPPGSVALDSGFTVLRDGWSPSDFYMAIDHGPLGGQHSHIDTLGFVATAHGRPVALDAGIGTSYEDPRYVRWFRSLRAHNVVAIDDVETEKVAERTSWTPGREMDILSARSRAYEHALGIVHDRTFYFIKGVGWLIHDRLVASGPSGLAGRKIDWLLHTPYAIVPSGPGELHGEEAGGGLLVVAGNPADLESPLIERRPAAMASPGELAMRQWDAARLRQVSRKSTPEIASLAWRRKPVSGPVCEFAMLLLPYRGAPPRVSLAPVAEGWVLQLDLAQQNRQPANFLFTRRI